MRGLLGVLGVAIASLGLVASSAVAQNDAAAQQGNEAYQYWCATCHGQGPGHPGTTALAAKYKGALPGLLEERTDLTPTAIRFAVRRGTSIMPFFRKTEISDADLDAITQHLTRRRSTGR
ncbi:MAG TPA: cytochrome c [Vicinamibacterales bacterium]|nr:cytochrome c [Vicinamibacterales bacterium]